MERSFEEYLKRHEKMIRKISGFLGRRCSQDAEDLYSEGVIAAWNLYNKGEDLHDGVIYVIIYRRICDYLRSNIKSIKYIQLEWSNLNDASSENNFEPLFCDIKDEELRLFAILLINQYDIRYLMWLFDYSQKRFYKQKDRLRKYLEKSSEHF